MIETKTEPNYGVKAWTVVFTAALFFFYEFMQMNMFNAFDPYFMKEFHIGAAALGQLSANYFYGIVLFLFSAGIILDRFSTKRLILTAMAICLMCTFGLALVTQFWQAEIFRFITGIAAAFCLLSCVRLASRWFPPRRMALVIGLVVTMAMIGGMVAQTPFTLLSDTIGWRYTLFLDSAVGILIWVVIFLCVQDFPKDYQADFEVDAVDTVDTWAHLKKTIVVAARNLQNWLAGLYTCLMNLPLMLLGAIWGNLYLVTVEGITREQASLVTSMIFFGTVIGSPAIGWLSDRIKLRKQPMIWFAVLSIVLIFFIMDVPHLSLTSLLILFFLLGFVTSAQIISYPLVAESNSLAITGTAEGLASTLIMAGGFMQPVFGWVMQWHWNHVVQNGIPIYAPSDYALAMWIMPIAFIVSLIAALFVRETHCRHYET